MGLRLFLSDLHIGDGTANDDFVYDRELIRLLNQMKDIDENYEIVFVGDVLEILEGDSVRKIGLVNFNKVCASLNEDAIGSIIEKHKILFEFLRSLVRTNKIYYIIGNHDYYLLFNQRLMNSLIDFMNSKNFIVTSYFYDEEDGILSQHGSQYDFIYSFSKDKENVLIPPLGDYITRYTMINFEPILHSVYLPVETVRDYDNIRPTMDVVDWLEYINMIYKIPVDLVGEWLRSFLKIFQTSEFNKWIRVKFPHTYPIGDFFFKNPIFFQIGRKITTLGDEIQKFRGVNYLKSKAEKILNAYHMPEWRLKEKDFLGYSDKMPDINYERLKIVVFGHNHLPGFYVIPTPKGPKYYINTGTWRPLVEKSRGKWGQRIFHKKVELNYAIISKDKNLLSAETHLVSRVILS
ncbi:metallophosphoesterase [Athalassotoga saccharophila]|uniref:metallophosphoesterase n=1 Tax=Athalassotoga saccharophila TaxID=1441386 RepID=UPI00137B3C0C|nr:metallophosphoesterase [Athalassotoga saccharophila]BBJ28578.1 hypothetical protein ATHSA_1496 [Athalassotoga saccharophila]